MKSRKTMYKIARDRVVEQGCIKVADDGKIGYGLSDYQLGNLFITHGYRRDTARKWKIEWLEVGYAEPYRAKMNDSVERGILFVGLTETEKAHLESMVKDLTAKFGRILQIVS